jgi:hypothetical protein
MTKALPFSENGVERVVNAAAKSGVNVGGVWVEPDGSILVLGAFAEDASKAYQHAARTPMDATARQYRREHRELLANHRSDVYAALLRAGRLDSYLISIGETASERLEPMSRHLADKELPELPLLERVRELHRQHEAEEIIRNDLILQLVGD